MYLTQANIANDESIHMRVTQAAAENGCAASGISPETWAYDWRNVWAAAPGWDDAWESAVAGSVENPGADPGVITDAMINSQVQSMMPFDYVSDHREVG